MSGYLLPFLLLLIVISIYDLRSKRIPNYLIAIGFIYGLFLSVFDLGRVTFLESLMGIILGGSLFLLPFIKSYVGAGDLKLMAMIGSYLGVYLTFLAFVYAAIIGGAGILIFLFYKKIIKDHPDESNQLISKINYLPYAYAISLGATFALLNTNQ